MDYILLILKEIFEQNLVKKSRQTRETRAAACLSRLAPSVTRVVIYVSRDDETLFQITGTSETLR